MANIIFTDMETGEQKTVEAGQVKKAGNTVKVAPQASAKASTHGPWKCFPTPRAWQAAHSVRTLRSRASHAAVWP